MDDVNNATMDDVNGMIDFGTDSDLDADYINDSWLTELATCASKAEELAIQMTLLFEVTSTPNSPVKTAATVQIAKFSQTNSPYCKKKPVPKMSERVCM
jgi:hypothetical protein